jgi:Recombination endonuclease VII
MYYIPPPRTDGSRLWYRPLGAHILHPTREERQQDPGITRRIQALVFEMHPRCLFGCGWKSQVLDHCWSHLWIRGGLCRACNRILEMVDSGLTVLEAFAEAAAKEDGGPVPLGPHLPDEELQALIRRAVGKDFAGVPWSEPAGFRFLIREYRREYCPDCCAGSYCELVTVAERK